MSDYPNMSYCMFENTRLAMDQVTNAMLDAESFDALDLSREERRAFLELYDLCQEYMRLAECLNDDAGGCGQ